MVSLCLVIALLAELVDSGNGFCRLAEYISTVNTAQQQDFQL